MLQTAHFILLFAISFGLVAIYIAYQLYREYRLKYLLSYVYILSGFNIINLAHSFETFFKLTGNNGQEPDSLIIYSAIISVLLSYIRIFLAYYFVFFLWGLTEKKWPDIFRKLCWSFTIIFLFVNIISCLNPLHLKGITIFAYNSVHTLFFIIVTLSLFSVLYSGMKIKIKGRKNAIILFTAFLLGFNIFLFMIRIVLYTGWISMDTQMILISLVMLIFNVTNTFYFKKFIKEYHINYQIKNENNLDFLVRKYNITEREKEIIVLTCQGKTNKEIADELFVTPVTVRDHLSNIYQKTSVKNRFGLSKLFGS